jgi:hypothetical protein
MTMLYNYNIILYTSKSIDSVTFILPRLLLIIIHIHRSKLYPLLTDQYNVYYINIIL